MKVAPATEETAATTPEAPAAPKAETGTNPTVEEAPAAPKSMTATPPAPQAPAEQNAMQALMVQAQEKQVALQEINMKLQEMQDKAMEDETLKGSMKALETKAIELMSKESDTAAEDYKAYKDLLEELEAEPSLKQGNIDDLSPELQAKVEKLQGLGQKLQPMQAKVQQDPEVQTLQSNLMNDMLKVMSEQNPEFDKLNEQRETIMAEVQELQRKFQTQMMQQQQLQQQMQQGQGAPGQDPAPMPPVPKVP